MTNYHPLFFITISFIYFHFVISSKSKHPGHLKPFGALGPFDEIEEYNNDFPDPWTFFNEYLIKSRPVLFRQVHMNDSNRYLWENDETLDEFFANDQQLVHVETRKKESRQQNILTMTMKEFLKRYQKEELYLVEEVPNRLRPFFIVPKSLQCPMAMATFQVAMMWFSSGNTSSVLHTDDYDNINCVLQGDKYFILIDPNENPEVAAEIIDVHSGSYSTMDVDRVDYKKFQSLNNGNLRYYQVKLTPGDCLFLPALWIHQVRSNYRNIAVNYWLDHQRAKIVQIDRESCEPIDPSKFVTLETIVWPSMKNNVNHLRDFMFNLVDDRLINFRQWTKQFSKEIDFDLQSDTKTINGFAEFFNVIDKNENGYITEEEIESAFDSDTGAVAFEILQDILDIIDVKLGKKAPSVPSLNEYLDDENLSEIDSNYTTLNSDDDDDEELIEHDDL